MDNPTMADLLLGRKPVMPEEYDRQDMPLQQYLWPAAKAFGSGLVDPMGMTGMALGAAGYDHQARRLKEMRAENPVAAGMGSMLAPGLGVMKAGGMTVRELMNLPGIASLMGAGGYLGDIANKDFDMMRPAPRAQGSYPPEGAY